MTIEDNSNFSIEEAGKKNIGYSHSTMIFVNQLNVFRSVVKNYVKLQRNRRFIKEYTPELLLAKLDTFVDRLG